MKRSLLETGWNEDIGSDPREPRRDGDGAFKSRSSVRASWNLAPDQGDERGSYEKNGRTTHALVTEAEPQKSHSRMVGRSRFPTDFCCATRKDSRIKVGTSSLSLMCAAWRRLFLSVA